MRGGEGKKRGNKRRPREKGRGRGREYRVSGPREEGSEGELWKRGEARGERRGEMREGEQKA